MIESKPPQEAPRPVELNLRDQATQRLVIKDPLNKDSQARSDEKVELMKKLGRIIQDFAGVESNIPLTHEYWNLLNRFRSL